MSFSQTKKKGKAEYVTKKYSKGKQIFIEFRSSCA